MDFTILLDGFLVFLICLFLHIIIWRWRYPRNRPAALILIFIIIPPVLALGWHALVTLGILPGMDNLIALSFTDWAAVYLLHFALSTSYILGYPAVEAVSPSLMILLMIGDSRQSGLRYDDMLHCFDDGDLLQPRIKDLIDVGWITESDGSFSVTSRGFRILLFYMFFHRLLGMTRVKG